MLSFMNCHNNQIITKQGEIKTTLAELIDTREIAWKQWDFKKRRYKAKNCGELLIHHSNIIKKHSFVSFLNGGLELELLVAIDFTGSNGDPRDKKSLHYMGLVFFSLFPMSFFFCCFFCF